MTAKIEPLPHSSGQYTTSLALSPDDRFLYYVGGNCSGQSWQEGCPVVQYDLRRRRAKVIAFLHPYYKEKYDYLCGGTFGLVIDPTGRRLFIAMNGNIESMGFRQTHGFGVPAIFVVHLAAADVR